MQEKIKNLVESNKFQIAIIAIIIVNAIILGLETSKYVKSNYGSLVGFIDNFILIIFVVEISLRLYAYRWRFFLRPWSLFDFCIILIALAPTAGPFAALRALRVLRVLRLVSSIPSMRKVIEGLVTAIPGIISVSSIIMIFFYIFAVIGTHLYGQSFPQWFGDLGKTMFTLFQVMTLESWSMGIVRPIMEQHPSAWLFFIMYILVTTFTMLNLFIAIIVNAMHVGDEASAREDREDIKESLMKEIKDLKKIVQKLK